MPNNENEEGFHYINSFLQEDYNNRGFLYLNYPFLTS